MRYKCFIILILLIYVNINVGYSQSLNRKFTHNIAETSFKKMYDTISLMFIGDLMLHTPQIKNGHINNMQIEDPFAYNFNATFKYILPYINKSDIIGANMEFTLGGYPYTGYPNFSSPDAIAHCAKNNGINTFFTANNHILDKGKKGLERTLNIYKSIGINYTGAFIDEKDKELNNPLIILKNNIKIAIINFTYSTNGIPSPNPVKINYMDSLDVKKSIGKAKELGSDIIIAIPHWGNEYQLKQSTEQEIWARMLFREGVRIIIGSHPHVTQEAILYNKENNITEKFVFYSLGNFISNQSNPDFTQLGLMVYFCIVKDNFTNSINIIKPNYKYLWTFKANEFMDKFTVIPIDEAINLKDSIKNKHQYNRMINTYNQVLNLNQIKEIDIWQKR